MPRTPRITIPGAPHHILARGNNRRRLFSYRVEYRTMLSLVRVGLKISECVLHQITLMTNHLHMILTPAHERSLATFAKYVFQRYAQLRNKARRGTGKLFEERFKSIPIESEPQLATTTMYNDTNGFRAGMVQDPADHCWSTCGMHMGAPSNSAIPRDIWTPSDWYRSLGAGSAQRGEHYTQLLHEYLGRRRAEQLEQRRSDRSRLERPDGSSAA